MCPLSKNSTQKTLAMEIASASISMQISMQFNCAHKHEQAQHKGYSFLCKILQNILKLT